VDILVGYQKLILISRVCVCGVDDQKPRGTWAAKVSSCCGAGEATVSGNWSEGTCHSEPTACVWLERYQSQVKASDRTARHHYRVLHLLSYVLDISVDACGDVATFDSSIIKF